MLLKQQIPVHSGTSFFFCFFFFCGLGSFEIGSKFYLQIIEHCFTLFFQCFNCHLFPHFTPCLPHALKVASTSSRSERSKETCVVSQGQTGIFVGIAMFGELTRLSKHLLIISVNIHVM